MTNKYKEAFQSAEQEIEEKSIAELKKTIKEILQKKKNLEDDRDEIDAEIKLLKQDIEDFKTGRLDKVKERHECDERAQTVFPITINIVKQEVISKPWTWTYELIPRQTLSLHSGSTLTNLSVGQGSITHITSSCNTSGTNCVYLSGGNAQSFTGGTYTVSGTNGNSIINL